MGVAPAKSLDRSLVGRTGPGLQLSIPRSKSQVCSRVHSRDQVLQACLWGHRWACLPPGPWVGRTAFGLLPRGTGSNLQGCFKNQNWTEFGRPDSGHTNGLVSCWVPRMGTTAHRPLLRGVRAKLQGRFIIHSWTEVGGPAPRAQIDVSSAWFLVKQNCPLDCSGAHLEPGYRTTSRSAVGPRSAGLPLGASTGVPPSMSLGNSTAPRPGLRGTGTASWATTGSKSRTKVSGPVTWDIGGRDSSWVPWQIVLVAGPRPNRTVAASTSGQAISGSVARAKVGKPATWAWASFLKLVLGSCGLHQGFTSSYLDPKAPTNALLSMDGCQIVVVGVYE